MSEDERGRTSFLDLLTETLVKHEKNLDKLIERLEKFDGFCEGLMTLPEILKEIDKRLDNIAPMLKYDDEGKAFWEGKRQGLLAAKNIVNLTLKKINQKEVLDL